MTEEAQSSVEGGHDVLAEGVREHPGPLHVGRLDGSLVFSLDISCLLEGEKRKTDWNNLLECRVGGHNATASEFSAIAESNASVSTSYADEIRVRVNGARAAERKQIWTDAFLEFEAPLSLDIPPQMTVRERSIASTKRVEDDEAEDPLHFVKFDKHSMKLYREGIFTYTIDYRVVNSITSTKRVAGDGSGLPLTVHRAISILREFELVSWEAFHHELKRWLARTDSQDALRSILQIESSIQLHSAIDDLKKYAKIHRLLFLDAFYRCDPQDQSQPFAGWSPVSPAQALADVAPAGLLNAADWYEKYRPEYLAQLAGKNIGYRDDELYVTDRKATLISNRAFWVTNDSLREYRRDIVLATEYWTARFTQAHSMLDYLQTHDDFLRLDDGTPADGLDVVVKALRVFARLEESLDPARLLDHGFSRTYVSQLYEEMGFDSILRFIRNRLRDASTGISLRSSVSASAVDSPRIRTLTVWVLVVTVLTLVVATATALLGR